MKMELIECSETSAYKIQTPGNHPEENIQHTEHGESLKSKIVRRLIDIIIIIIIINVSYTVAASCWSFYKNCVMMHETVNVKLSGFLTYFCSC
jgi:hypothetical protein